MQLKPSRNIWLTSANVTTSRYFAFRSIQMEANSFKLKVGNTMLNRSKWIKYFGVKLTNELLKFSHHLELASKACDALIFQKRADLSTETKLIPYQSLIRPIIYYIIYKRALRGSHTQRKLWSLASNRNSLCTP